MVSNMEPIILKCAVCGQDYTPVPDHDCAGLKGGQCDCIWPNTCENCQKEGYPYSYQTHDDIGEGYPYKYWGPPNKHLKRR